jgi:arsenate reductase
MTQQTVLFACIQNAGRSQMAAALFNTMADPAKARALSAGTRPGAAVHPEVAETMREVGIDLSSATPRLLTDDLVGGVSMLITMGCGEECPYVPGVERDEWALPDPKGRPIEEVRAIREDIRARVEWLIDERGWALP